MYDYSQDALRHAIKGVRDWMTEAILERHNHIFIGISLFDLGDNLSVERFDFSKLDIPDQAKASFTAYQKQIKAIRLAGREMVERIEELSWLTTE